MRRGLEVGQVWELPAFDGPPKRAARRYTIVDVDEAAGTAVCKTDRHGPKVMLPDDHRLALVHDPKQQRLDLEGSTDAS